MKNNHLHALVRIIRKMVGADLSSDTDEQLLYRFAHERDQSAFALLVERHAAMVLGVCGRVLGDVNDAEDAFQATFLVLVGKARSIRRPHLLANWLYGVARRTALEARTRAARRQVKEREVMQSASGAASAAEVWAELRPVLDEELERLPKRYRVPFVLCYLEGRTNEEAARILGCPKGTVQSRLASARERLRGRLSKRGMAPSAGLVAAALSSSAVKAAVAPALVRSTIAAALAFAAGTSTVASITAISLAKGVLIHMFWTKVFNVATVLAVVGLVGGAGVLAWPGIEKGWDGPKNEVSQQEPLKAQQPAEKKQEDKKDEIPAADEVIIVQPIVREVNDIRYCPGKTGYFDAIELRSRVTGYLVKVHVANGAEVKKGDILFELDSRAYQAELNRALAILAQSESRVKEAENQFKAVEAQSKSIEFDKLKLSSAAAALSEAKAGVLVAQASLEIPHLNLSFTKVTAPISGIIKGPLLNAGSLVKADDAVLGKVAIQDPMVVDFTIDEDTALRMRQMLKSRKAKEGENLPIAMRLKSVNEFSHFGKVELRDFTVENREAHFRALFPNNDGFLVPGLSCELRLRIGEPYKAMLVPQSALVLDTTDNGQRFSLLIVNAKNVVEKRMVGASVLNMIPDGHGDFGAHGFDIVGRMGDYLAKVWDGLKAQEWIILDAKKTDLKPGQTVKTRKGSVPLKGQPEKVR